MSELILYLQVQILDTKLFRIRIRVRITEPESSLDTGHKYPDLKSRSIDRTENITELKGVLTQKSRAEIQSLRTGITSNQFQDHLLKKDQFVDDLFTLHLPDQPGTGTVCCVRCVRTEPGFSKSIFSSQITGNEVSFKFRIENQTSLEDQINLGLTDQVQVQVFGINQINQ